MSNFKNHPRVTKEEFEKLPVKLETLEDGRQSVTVTVNDYSRATTVEQPFTIADLRNSIMLLEYAFVESEPPPTPEELYAERNPPRT